MSAPILWIIVPIIIAGVFFFLRRLKMVVLVSATILTFLLALIAWLIPINELVVVGPWSFTLLDRIAFAGRQFVLSNADRPTLVVIFFTLTLFFAGTFVAGVSNLYIPVSLAMSAVLVASLAVEPFLYAFLFVQVAVLMSIPLLSPPGSQIERGVLRYLTLMSFGLPFMLVGGWLLSELKPSTSDLKTLYSVLIFLGMGFAFLLAIFPLNFWIPMLTERNHPYSAAFLFSMLPMIVIFFLMRFIGLYPWLLDLEIIQFLGLLMVITGGLWAAFQRDLGRMLGYAVIIEIGQSILAVSQHDGLDIYAAMFLPRLLGITVWALALSLIRRQVDDLSFRSVQGIGRRFPLLVIGVLAAHFSMAGFPLLAGFPSLFLLWETLAQTSAIISLLALLGSFGLVVGGLRSLAAFVMGQKELPSIDFSYSRISQVYLFLGVFAIILVGLFPQWFSPFFVDFLSISF